jgi:protein SCO1/2
MYMKGFICTLILGLLLVASCAKPDLPVMSSAPAFNLIERSTREVKSQELAGQVWIADFVFTSCGGMCPVMTSKMRTLQDKLSADVRLVSFSVDPDTDTPAVLTDYAKRYGADPNRWLFLTGDKAELYRISKEGFKLALDDTGGTQAEPITHSSRFVLIDRQGQIRGYYSMEDDSEMTRIVRDAKSLLKG